MDGQNKPPLSGLFYLKSLFSDVFARVPLPIKTVVLKSNYMGVFGKFDGEFNLNLFLFLG